MSGSVEIERRGADIRAQLTGKPCGEGRRCFDMFCLDDHPRAVCPACGKPCDAEAVQHLRMCDACFCPGCGEACGGTCAELREVLR